MKGKVSINISVEELNNMIKTAVTTAVGEALSSNLEKVSLLDYKQVTQLYGFSRQTIFNDIEKGTIPAVACTYKNGKRYISEAMLDDIPKYYERKKPA